MRIIKLTLGKKYKVSLKVDLISLCSMRKIKGLLGESPFPTPYGFMTPCADLNNPPLYRLSYSTFLVAPPLAFLQILGSYPRTRHLSVGSFDCPTINVSFLLREVNILRVINITLDKERAYVSPISNFLRDCSNKTLLCSSSFRYSSLIFSDSAFFTGLFLNFVKSIVKPSFLL